MCGGSHKLRKNHTVRLASDHNSDGKRIYSIENGSRELALVRRKDGRVVNSVIHTLTRDSENERQRVDQIALLDMALRFNPDIIVVGEMRGPEANAAQEQPEPVLRL